MNQEKRKYYLKKLQKLSKNKLLDCATEIIKCIPGTQGNVVYPFKNAPIITAKNNQYVPDLKVMLAENYFDRKTHEPITLQKEYIRQGIPNPPIGWWMSEKYDGIRAIWDGQKFVSRGSHIGNPKIFTYVPQWFMDLMPPGIALDGEIFGGRGTFQNFSSISNLKPGGKYTEEQINKLWYEASYQIFDVPELDASFEDRMLFIEQIVEDRCKCWKKIRLPNYILNNQPKRSCPLLVTKQFKVKSEEQLSELYDELVSQGAEGAILRAPHSPYEQKRSRLMLKLKPKEDAECVITGYYPGTGKYDKLVGTDKQGNPIPMLGSFKCQMIEKGVLKSITFKVPGMTDIIREQYWNPTSKYYHPIGTVITYTYMEQTRDGKPRHPEYKGIRTDVQAPTTTKPLSADEVKEFNKLSGRFEFNPTIGDYPINQDVIDAFEAMIQKVTATKEPHWQFKVANYKKGIGIVKKYDQPIKTKQQALEMFQAGGMKKPVKLLDKIEEVLTTGQLRAAEEAKANPEIKAITILSSVPEIGPSTARKLYKDHNIETISQLKQTVERNPNILNRKQLIGLKYYDDLVDSTTLKQRRIPRTEIKKYEQLFKANADEFKGMDVSIVGSYRRELPTSGDIDVLVTVYGASKTVGQQLFKEYVEQLIENDVLTETWSFGSTKFIGLGQLPYQMARHIDLLYTVPDEYPFHLQYFTGSKEHNIELRKLANEQGFSLNENNFTYLKGPHKGKVVSSKEIRKRIGKDEFTNECDIYHFLGVQCPRPPNRESGNLRSK